MWILCSNPPYHRRNRGRSLTSHTTKIQNWGYTFVYPTASCCRWCPRKVSVCNFTDYYLIEIQFYVSPNSSIIDWPSLMCERLIIWSQIYDFTLNVRCVLTLTGDKNHGIPARTYSHAVLMCLAVWAGLYKSCARVSAVSPQCLPSVAPLPCGTPGLSRRCSRWRRAARWCWSCAGPPPGSRWRGPACCTATRQASTEWRGALWK